MARRAVVHHRALIRVNIKALTPVPRLNVKKKVIIWITINPASIHKELRGNTRKGGTVRDRNLMNISLNFVCLVTACHSEGDNKRFTIMFYSSVDLPDSGPVMSPH